MILVDTSIWVDHLRKGNKSLSILLQNGHVVCHPFVVGELACGNLKNREKLLQLLNELPTAITADHSEVLELVEQQNLMGKGIGWIDAHLLTSSLLSNVLLWSRDNALINSATLLKCDFREERY